MGTFIQRPRFYEGQYLNAADLAAEVDYARSQEARHALGAHTWGIAAGLTLREIPTSGGANQIDVVLNPGYAFDGFGRGIVVLYPTKLPANKFAEIVYDPALDDPAMNGGTPGRLVDVWVRYREFETQPASNGFQVCDNSDQNARVQETFIIEIGERKNLRDRRDTIIIGGVATDAADALKAFDPAAPALPDASVPHQNLPADGDDLWLIPIGKVRWNPGQGGAAGNFVPLTDADKALSAAARIYIGVVAAAVQGPNGVVRLKDRSLEGPGSSKNDVAWVEGKLRLYDDARLFGGKIEFLTAGGGDNGAPIELRRGGGTELRAVIPLDNTGAFTPKVVVTDNGRLGVGTTAPSTAVDASQGAIRWGNGSELGTGSEDYIELSGRDDIPGKGKPRIDFHFDQIQQDFNARIVNEADGLLKVDVQRLQATGKVGVQTSNPVEAVTIANNGNLMFLGAGTDAGDIIFADSNVNQKARIWSEPGAGSALYFSGNNQNVANLAVASNGNVGVGTITPQFRLDVNGTLKSPMWQVRQLLNNRQGPLPLSVNSVQLNGGTLVFLFSGSVSSSLLLGFGGLEVSLNGIVRAQSFVPLHSVGTNSMVPAQFAVVQGVAAGSYTVQLDVFGLGISSNVNDIYNLTVFELPWP
jgi:hypothetical protein